MSGIAGIIHFDGRPVAPGEIEAMTASLGHRGPDGVRHWRLGSVALGHCMLRTTPESLEETQPWANEDESLVLVMDGRVDNWEELRRELLGSGAVLRSRADAELVLRAYEVWGTGFLPHVDGDFALVIWDARRRQAFCARDRLGNKPFFYHRDANTLVFASELRPILERPWVEAVPNESKLVEMLADQWPSRDQTLWTGVLRLDAAHVLDIGSAGAKVLKYWDPDLSEAQDRHTDQDHVDRYRSLLVDTVRRLSRSHRPLACEVSGGLDSSALMCVAARLHASGVLPAPDVRGYTLRFPAGGRADEIGYARAVGEFLGRPIRERPPTHRSPSWYRDEGHRLRDFPGYPNGVMHQGLWQSAVEDGAVVLLTGVGGDQWLQGRRGYYEEELRQGRWQNVWQCFRADADACGWRSATGWLARFGVYPLLPEWARKTWRGLRSAGPTPATGPGAYWLSPGAQRQLAAARERAAEAGAMAPVLRPGQRHLMNNLRYGFDTFGAELAERQGAALGLEVRHPFRTHRIVQFAFSTPERLRLRGAVNKYHHVQALRGWMPEAVVRRQDKAEFSQTFLAAIGEAEQQIERLGDHGLDGVLDPAGLRELLAAYRRAPTEGWQAWVLWNAMGCASALGDG